MSDELENVLRRALRPADPGELFTRRVLARLADEPARAPLPRLRARPAWLALAASLLLAVAGTAAWHHYRVAEGMQARAQLLEALRVTGRKLDVAYRAVNEPRPLSSDSGA
jgi:hypothetical protein